MTSNQERMTLTDKLGDPYDIVAATEEDLWALADMYDRFIPKALTQGLPPADDDARINWLRGLLRTGVNFIAWHGGAVVGHASLIMEQGNPQGEYLIFVNQSFRNRGLGTALTKLVVDRAGELGLTSIWLTVEALNFRAIKLYRNMGFVFCDAGERERSMILRL
jgi:RimJ/RimL family protein N-acetyltransferase